MKTKLLVKKILENPIGHDWSIQGFGMLRLYLSPELRMHIWHSAHTVKNVSVIHTHPWDFSSEVVGGKISNILYREQKGAGGPNVEMYHFAKIKCGVGGGIAKGELEAERGTKCLFRCVAQIHHQGQCYEQEAEEIHESQPEDGTVTLVTRIFKKDPDHAYVFWKEGEWVSAEPRRATKEEVLSFTAAALKWFQ